MNELIEMFEKLDDESQMELLNSDNPEIKEAIRCINFFRFFEKLKQIEYKIVEEGLDVEGLKKIRRKLYRFKDDDLHLKEYEIKHNLLDHITVLLADEREQL